MGPMRHGEEGVARSCCRQVVRSGVGRGGIDSVQTVGRGVWGGGMGMQQRCATVPAVCFKLAAIECPRQWAINGRV